MPPPITALVEPFEAGKFVYLPMAPITSNSKARGRVFLRFDITNTGADPLTVTSVKISFPGSSVPAETKTIGIQVDPAKMRRWWFGKPADDILFDLPGPTTIE